ncbi:MAG TPA: hypothetical protein VMV75_02010 [Sulfuricella sp.]|nr:hypothetical protein [Sulfuricella sp.]
MVHLSKTAFLTVLLWAAATFCSPLFAAPTDLQLPDGSVADLRIFPAGGDTLILWLACDEGHGTWEPKAAQALAAGGIEVWLSDLLGAHFLPLAPSSIKQISGEEIALLIEHVRTQSGKKKIYLVAAGPASLLVLRGAIEWQWKHPDNPALAGGILLYPELYAVTPAPGVEAIYAPEVARNPLPLFIYHSQRSPGRWWLEHLKVELRKNGQRVDSLVLPGIRGFFYSRQDATPEENAMAQRLPELLRDALNHLQSTGNKP